MNSLQLQSLASSVTNFVQQMPPGRDRSELEQLMAVQSDERQRRSIRKRAALYPLMILILCASVLLFLCVVVVPTFDKMFDEFGLQLPVLTSLVLGLAEQIDRHPVRLMMSLLALIVVAVAVVRLLQSFAFGTRYLGLVYAGSTPHLVTMAGICNRLAEALSQNHSLPESLRLAAEACDNSYYAAALRTLAQDATKAGRGLSSSPVANNFPANLIYALSVGPNGSANIPLLKALEDIYRERASGRWDIHRGFTGPLAVILMGMVVAIVAVSLFQPLVQLISGLS